MATDAASLPGELYDPAKHGPIIPPAVASLPGELYDPKKHGPIIPPAHASIRDIPGLPGPAPSVRAQAGGLVDLWRRYDPSNPRNVGRLGKLIIRDVPATALQTGGAVGGGLLGAAVPALGETGISEAAGAALGGAAGSIAADEYTQFIDRLFGDQPAPINYGRSAIMGAIGSVTPELKAGEALSGLRGARLTAKEGARTALEQGEQLARQQAETRSEIADQLQRKVAAERAKLTTHVRKSLESAREESAGREAGRQVEGMLGKTPAQFAEQEALPYQKYAPLRSQVRRAYFDTERGLHEEIGRKFDPYIGKHADEVLPAEQLAGLKEDIERISNTLDARGQRMISAEGKRVLDDVTSAGQEAQYADPLAPKRDVPKTDLGRLNPADPAQAKLIARLRQASIAPVQEAGKDLTIGQIWGKRSRLLAVARSATNPADQWAALQGADAIMKRLPFIPKQIREEYGLSKALYDPSMSRAIATARTPGEMGAAIFGSPSSPEPAQVALNLIRRAGTSEQIEGLRTAFADNWLAAARKPEDFGKYLRTHRSVVRALYGPRADAVERIFGPEANVKAASWTQLIQSSPQARADFQRALRDSYRDQQAQAMSQAIREGQAALRELPGRSDAALKALALAGTPEAKLKILAQQLPNPQQAAVASLGELTPARMEGYGARRLAFDAAMTAVTGYGLLAKNPMAGVIGGGLLGGRFMIRALLTNPEIAGWYVRMLDLEPNPRNAVKLGRIMGPLAGAAITQTVKDEMQDNAVR